MFEHAIDCVQQLPHHSNDGDHLGFAPIQQLLGVEGPAGLMSDRDLGRHVERAADAGIPDFADAFRGVDRRFRFSGTRVQPGMRHPLAHAYPGR